MGSNSRRRGTDYAMLKTGYDLSRNISEGFLEACEARGVPIEALLRLVTSKGRVTLDALSERVMLDWREEMTTPTKSKRRKPLVLPTGLAIFAQVVYAIPAMDELRRRFPAYVNPSYDEVTFEPIEVCQNVDRTTREIGFEYLHLGRRASTGFALAELEKRALSPALIEEALSYDLKFPGEMEKHDIVVLGSVARDRGYMDYASLSRGPNGRRLNLGGDPDGGWNAECRFLGVRRR